MRTYIFIIKTENGKERFATGAIDYCNALERLHNYASANYYEWEIINDWRM